MVFYYSLKFGYRNCACRITSKSRIAALIAWANAPDHLQGLQGYKVTDWTVMIL